MYALIKNNQVQKYPYWISDFLRENPNISLPLEPTKSQLEEQGIFEVADAGQPIVDYTKIVEEVNPTLVNGKWTRTWSIRDASQAEQEANKSRIQTEIIEETQRRLDSFAQTRKYDSILSAATYATSTVPKFQVEGQYAVEARDNTWKKLYEILAEVEAETRPMPNNYADVESALPVLNWPN